MIDRDGEDQAFVDAISEWPDINDGPPTLAGFLLARITEDEGVARGGFWSETHPWELGHVCERGCISVDARRVLAECEAKRRIVERALGPIAHAGQDIERTATLRLLALPYADHPDYRDEWRP